MALVAGADLGSNNFRLLVADEISPGVFEEVALHNRIVRAGQGIGSGGEVAAEAVERVRACLCEFAEILDYCGVGRRVAALTAAGRDLKGGGLYADLARETLRAEVFVPDGEEEAKLAFAGATGLLGIASGDRLMLDIGGGSTEVAWATDANGTGFESMRIGVVRLTEESRLPFPAGAAGYQRLKARAAEAFSTSRGCAVLNSWRARSRQGGVRPVITAGTALTLAAHVSGRPVSATRGLTGIVVGAGEVEGFASLLCGLDMGGIEALPAVAPGRADVILAGVAILSAFMEMAGVAECVVSDGGLAEGLVFGLSRGASGKIEYRAKVKV